MAKARRIRSASGWKKVSKEDLAAAGVGRLLEEYGSKEALLRAVVPDLLAMRRNKKISAAEAAAALDVLKAKHNVVEPQDWRRVTVRELRDALGRGWRERFGSVPELLKGTYGELRDVPDEVIYPPSRRRGYWALAENRRSALERIAADLGVERVEDWKKVRTVDIKEKGGGSLLSMYKNSVFSMLKDLYPERDLKEHECRSSMPHRYWESAENRRTFMEMVAKELNVTSPEDWGRVSYVEVVGLGGGRLLRSYGDSVFDAARDLFPELEISEVHRSRVKKGHWDNIEEARRFLRNFATSRGIRSPAEWRSVTEADLKAEGGGTLLKKHSNLFSLLCAAFPEEQWDALECRERLPSAYWEEDSNVAAFVTSLAETHDVRVESDWLRISGEQVREAGGGGLLKVMTLRQAVELTFPGIQLPAAHGVCGARKRAVQGSLLRQLRGLVEPQAGLN